MTVDFLALAIAARRLGLDEGELGESVLHALGCGWDEMEAVRMSIIDVLQRRGAYRGRLKKAIDDGTIFQVSEDTAPRTRCKRPQKAHKSPPLNADAG